MKKTGFIMRIVAAGLIILFGAIIAINGLDGSSGFYYSGTWTSDKTYGGDAYTGIQNSVADVSGNVSELGDAFEYFFDELFMWSGFVILSLGVYLLACTFYTYERAPKKATEDELVTIGKYKELLDQGIITQEEFDVKKKQLLGLKYLHHTTNRNSEVTKNSEP